MENENYATREFPLKIETMCVRNPFDAHNPIYHPYHNTSNFVSVEEFYERYKKDNPSYELTKDYSSRKYAEYTDEMVFKSAIHILREENNGKPFNFLQRLKRFYFHLIFGMIGMYLIALERYIMESLKIKKYLDNCSINTIGSLR